MRRLACLPVILLMLLASIPARASHSNPKLVGGPGHPPPEENQGRTPDSPSTTAHLKYYGGRVISNAQIVQVLWGTGSYLPEVAVTGTPSVASFYQQVFNSAYVDWLSEYNTTLPGGTNQTIGRGSFVQQVTITPSVTGSSITDAQIQAEIAAQLAAGHLPAPTMDAAGNTNTIYMIYFPYGISISNGGNSCQAGGFCGYHGTIGAAGPRPELYYGVIPDMQAGSGCDVGCGNAATTFGNVTAVSSHELVEAITDPEVSLATVYGPPLGWYDTVHAEIGDICNQQQASTVGGDGQTYVVQKEFSNYANACIVARAPTNAFSVSLVPSVVSIPRALGGTVTVGTQTTSGSAQSVALAAGSLPSGVTGNVAPSPVMSGASSTLFLSVQASVAPGSYPFTVTGSATSGTHSAGGTLVVTAAGTGPIVNGDFELGNFIGWTTAGASETMSTSGCHGGSRCARLGGVVATNGDSTIVQAFVAEAGAVQLSFWYKNVCTDLVAYDWTVATLTDSAGTPSTILPRTCAASAVWTQVTAPVTPGHAYTLVLSNHDDNASADPSYTMFDDVATVCGSAADCDDGNPCTDDACVVSACAHTNSTSACDDGSACTVGDTCSNGLCTGGTTITAPPETDNVVAADKITYNWSAATYATQYDVVRGSLAALPVGPGAGDESCFDDLPGTTLSDASVPVPGSGYWYLSRGENACGIGAWGDATSGPRITTTCP